MSRGQLAANGSNPATTPRFWYFKLLFKSNRSNALGGHSSRPEIGYLGVLRAREGACRWARARRRLSPMHFGSHPPVIDPATGRVKWTVPSNWLKPPLREWTVAVVGLVLGLLLGKLVSAVAGGKRRDPPRVPAVTARRGEPPPCLGTSPRPRT